MGDKVEPRRKWIESNVHFNLDEDGSLLDNEAVSSAHEQADEELAQQLKQ